MPIRWGPKNHEVLTVIRFTSISPFVLMVLMCLHIPALIPRREKFTTIVYLKKAIQSPTSDILVTNEDEFAR